MIFPVAFMANTFGMVLVMIFLAVLGRPELAADFGIVHGATVALFFALSGNARSLILGGGRGVGAEEILGLRLALLIPLGFVAFVMSVGVVGNGAFLVALLVIRRAVEWLAEVFLSEQERRSERRGVWVYIAVQALFGPLLLYSLAFDSRYALPVAALWAVSPLLACGDRNLWIRCSGWSFRGGALLKSLLPHFGSTLVIGASVYLFRLFVLTVTDREVAGQLFAAFSVGGLLAGIYSQALGPTLLLGKTKSIRFASRFFGYAVLVSALLGMGLIALIIVLPGALHWTDQSDLFLLALGCSLVGSWVMVKGQAIRLAILQRQQEGDVFGSDVLANVLLLVAVPVLFHLFGELSLSALYLTGSILAWLFYSSELSGLFGRGGRNRDVIFRWVAGVIVVGLIVPVFFQIGSGLFTDRAPDFQSGANLGQLPLPLSVGVCFAGILALGGYHRARFSSMAVFTLVAGMLFSTALVSVVESGHDAGRIMILVQFVLPVFALILGQQFYAKDPNLEVLVFCCFWVLMVILPLQILATYLGDLQNLAAHAFLFSIYQHLQYVPVMFVAMFLLVVFSDKAIGFPDCLIPLLSLLMGVYVVLSMSMLAMGLLAIGVLTYGIYRWLLSGAVFSRRFVSTGMMSLTGGLLALWLYMGESVPFVAKFDFRSEVALEETDGPVSVESVISPVIQDELHFPPNVMERIDYWDFYLNKVLERWDFFLLGNPGVLDREQFPSAHNYYLDMLYHFGFVALLPVLGLIFATGWMVFSARRSIRSHFNLVGLLVVVVFLVGIDNMLKVGMRQPYSGIITFFLWGILISALSGLKYRSLGCPHDEGRVNSLFSGGGVIPPRDQSTGLAP